MFLEKMKCADNLISRGRNIQVDGIAKYKGHVLGTDLKCLSNKGEDRGEVREPCYSEPWGLWLGWGL